MECIDKVDYYTKIISDLMIKYKELFPVVETLYRGHNTLKIKSEEKSKLLKIEVQSYIGLKEHIRNIINTPFYVSLFLVPLPKQFKGNKFYDYQKIIDKSVCHAVFSIYIRNMITLENRFIQKCLSDLKLSGISFSLDQEETTIYNFYGESIGKRKLENVVFQKDDKIFKINNWIFFRRGGISCILETRNSTKKGEENFMKLHPITDAEFYEMQRQIIEYCFKPKPKENV